MPVLRQSTISAEAHERVASDLALGNYVNESHEICTTGTITYANGSLIIVILPVLYLVIVQGKVHALALFM